MLISLKKSAKSTYSSIVNIVNNLASGASKIVQGQKLKLLFYFADFTGFPGGFF